MSRCVCLGFTSVSPHSPKLGLFYSYHLLLLGAYAVHQRAQVSCPLHLQAQGAKDDDWLRSWGVDGLGRKGRAGRDGQWTQVFPPCGFPGSRSPCLQMALPFPFSVLCLPLKSPSLSPGINSRLLRVPSFVRFCPCTEFLHYITYLLTRTV